MTHHPEEHTPQEATYFVDAENAAEMARLTKQGGLFTNVMGGALAGLEIDAQFAHILDVACGPGEWVLDVAQQLPDSEVTGIDISQLMIEYARYKAASLALSNVHFRVMNVLEPLRFPDQSFDFVNVRLTASFQTQTTWPMFVQECWRIAASGGIIRLTDCEPCHSNCAAFDTYFALIGQAFLRAGMSYSPSGRHLGITTMLGRFLQTVGCRKIQQRGFAIDFSAGTEAHPIVCEDMRTFLKLVQPFLVKQGVATQLELETLYQRTIREMAADDFCAIWYFSSVWGEKP